MQFAWCEARVLELKDGRSRLGESESWGPSVGVQLVGVSHVLSRVCDVLTENRRLRKGWHRAVTGSPALEVVARGDRFEQFFGSGGPNGPTSRAVRHGRTSFDFPIRSAVLSSGRQTWDPRFLHKVLAYMQLGL